MGIGLMSRTLIRGGEFHGPRVEVTFGDPITFRTGEVGTMPLVVCENCGTLVAHEERHADWHYGIAAGRPWGAGPPPGFRT